MADASIAAILNRSGKLTGRGNGWTRARSLRHQQDIDPYVAGERKERGKRRSTKLRKFWWSVRQRYAE
jgi:hypothetical protein